VVAAGRFVREKGFDVLLRAMRSVRDSRVCKLILLGEGPLRDSLNALVSEMGLAADVDFPGFERNPFKFMANADAFVLSSRFEGLPGVLIQAMACGAPVVATDCPSGPSEIISAPGKNGLLVPVDDVQALAAALTRLLDDRPLREMLRREAPRAVERFTVRSSLARYIEAIDPSQP
jgi:glycosyltransferase involved in cell wall biosynthesis